MKGTWDSSSAEFDEYARLSYDAGMDVSCKKKLGGTQDVFIRMKARLLRRICPELEDTRLLDFGCGDGLMLEILRSEVKGAALSGCDISRKMLVLAGRRPSLASVSLALMEASQIPFTEDSFDVVTASCVFHHIPPMERLCSLREVFRVLRPGGRFVLFEHNPWNPLTTFVVKRTPIDRNAVLLSAHHASQLLCSTGFESVRVRHFVFFPPRFKFLWKAEDYLSWIPIGGQYVCFGLKGGAQAPLPSSFRS